MAAQTAALKLSAIFGTLYLVIGLCELPPIRDFVGAPLRNIEPSFWLSAFTLALFNLTHAAASHGLQDSLVFFACVYLVVFAVEFVGLRTGVVFGQYQFADRFGPHLFGVPVGVPLLWYTLAYPSLDVGKLISWFLSQFRPIANLSTFAMFFIETAAASFALMISDMCCDPLMSSSAGRFRLKYDAFADIPTNIPPDWRWLDADAAQFPDFVTASGFFGVPYRNFVGWFVTGFIFYWLSSLLAGTLNVGAHHSAFTFSRRFYRRDGSHLLKRPFFFLATCAPALMYFCTTLFYALHPTTPALLRVLIAVFVCFPVALLLGWAVFVISSGKDADE